MEPSIGLNPAPAMSKKTKRIIVDVVSIAVAATGGVLAVANEITAIQGIPGEWSNKWPLILVLSTLVNRVGQSIITKLT